MLIDIIDARKTNEPIIIVIATATRNGKIASAMSFATSDALWVVCQFTSCALFSSCDVLMIALIIFSRSL